MNKQCSIDTDPIDIRKFEMKMLIFCILLAGCGTAVEDVSELPPVIDTDKTLKWETGNWGEDWK